MLIESSNLNDPELGHWDIHIEVTKNVGDDLRSKVGILKTVACTFMYYMYDCCYCHEVWEHIHAETHNAQKSKFAINKNIYYLIYIY